MSASALVLVVWLVKTVMVLCAILVATVTMPDEDCLASVRACTQPIKPYLGRLDDMQSLDYLRIYDTICPYVSCYNLLTKAVLLTCSLS